MRVSVDRLVEIGIMNRLGCPPDAILSVELRLEEAKEMAIEVLAARRVVEAAWRAALTIDDDAEANAALVAALSAYDKETA